MLIPLDNLAMEINTRLVKADEIELQADEIRSKGDDHIISAGLIAIEARDRLQDGELPGVSWDQWRRDNLKKSKARIYQTIDIASSPDPKGRLSEMRQAARDRMYQSRLETEQKENVNSLEQEGVLDNKQENPVQPPSPPTVPVPPSWATSPPPPPAPSLAKASRAKPAKAPPAPPPAPAPAKAPKAPPAPPKKAPPISDRIEQALVYAVVKEEHGDVVDLVSRATIEIIDDIKALSKEMIALLVSLTQEELDIFWPEYVKRTKPK